MRRQSNSKKIIRFYNTVKYLQPVQIYYRLYYTLRSRLRRFSGFCYQRSVASKSVNIMLEPSIFSPNSSDCNAFTFLNITHQFKNKVDWNVSKYGKLWTYNLTYFDFLHQKNMTGNEGLRLMHDFIDQNLHVKDGLEPFPVSLRGINWIKFISYHKIQDQKIDDNLYAQYHILMDNVEYHLLGNHLLENAFSLLFGAYYFQDENLHVKAREMLFKELNEQILGDGAHFELSPMYHQIMLFRLLDCINLLQNNQQTNDKDLLAFLQQKAEQMLGWLKTITFKDGSIPLFNDSANHIAPTSGELFDYAMRLHLHVKETILKECGYRQYENENYECVVDVGNIGPDYIPGHAHADTFGFELHLNNKPFIVDTGLSTYETNDRRMLERATAAHNTVELNGLDQSDVWGAFRVANRAYVTVVQENRNSIKAVHHGYEKKLGALHEREFIFENNGVKIIDNIIAKEEHQAVARIHFHPSVDEARIHKHIVFHDAESVIKTYRYAPEFNQHVDAKVLEIRFIKKLKVTIAL